jgi:hypothetical protein
MKGISVAGILQSGVETLTFLCVFSSFCYFYFSVFHPSRLNVTVIRCYLTLCPYISLFLLFFLIL